MFQSRCNTKFSTHFTTEKKELCVTFEFKRTFFLSFFFFGNRGCRFAIVLSGVIVRLFLGIAALLHGVLLFTYRALFTSLPPSLSLSLCFSFPFSPFLSLSVFDGKQLHACTGTRLLRLLVNCTGTPHTHRDIQERKVGHSAESPPFVFVVAFFRTAFFFF